MNAYDKINELNDIAAKYGAKRVKRVCYETMLKEQGGTAV